MVWKDPHPKDGKFQVAPIPQFVTVQYRENRIQLPERNEYEEKAILKELGDIWYQSKTWRVSGGVATSGITKKYSHRHENLDVAVLRQPEPFHYMVEEAKKEGLFLFLRPRSYKRWFTSDYKHEKHIPVVDLDFLLNDFNFDLNPVFCRVDNNGNIISENTMHTRIKVFFYHQDGEYLSCSEDKSKIIPRLFNGLIIHKTKNHHEITSTHPLHLSDLYEKIIEKKSIYETIIQKNRKEKHIEKHTELWNWLRKNPKWQR